MKYLFATTCLLLGSAANAADKCSLLAQGALPQTQQLSMLINKAKQAHVVKGEFETTAAYAARAAPAASEFGLTSSRFVIEWPLDTPGFAYNADSEDFGNIEPRSVMPDTFSERRCKGGHHREIRKVYDSIVLHQTSCLANRRTTVYGVKRVWCCESGGSRRR